MAYKARIETARGDITEEETDAIVNAANSSLLGGGGVDGAIHRAAGPRLLEACREIRKKQYPHGLPPGEAVITPAFNLKAKYVIHTVGPVYNPKKDQSLVLKSCFLNSLRLAEERNLSSISFPAISTGAYGYPKEECARIMRQAFEEFPFRSLKLVRVVLFSGNDRRIFSEILGVEG